MRLLLILIAINLIARENPFKPVLKFSLPKKRVESFKKIETKLNGVILKRVIFEYQLIDGSVEKKEIVINKKIDPAKKIIVFQKKNREKKVILKVFKFLSFEIDGKKIRVYTTSPLIRDFSIIAAKKVVLDFKRSVNFRLKVIPIKSLYFKAIKIGNHSTFFRVVIELKEFLAYKVKKEKEYFEIVFY